MTAVDWSLNDRVAIVTGTAPGGIGEVYASVLAEAGAAVVCADISYEGAESVADALRERGHRSLAVATDISDADQVQGLVEATVSAFGGIDILVNNAALMARLPMGPVLGYSEDDLQRAFDVNFKGAFLCSRAVAPHMRRRGEGRIVNQVSASAFPPSSVYGITKLALIGLTTALAKELGRDCITVNAIAPGLTDSEAGQSLVPRDSEARVQMTQLNALGRAGDPNELAGALLLLTAPAGAWISGQVLNVDGGWVLRP